MDPATDSRPSVLVVEDDKMLADLYARWLEDECDVTAVYSGEAALESLHPGIDVVLLDRHMPDLSGDEVLVTLRDWGLGCRVVMVTGVSPDFDIVDLGFDDYLEKPVDGDDLVDAVERLCVLDSAEDLTIRLSSLRVRRNILEVEKSESALADDDGYQRLCTRIASLEEQLSDRRVARSKQQAD